jgi:hypothetical protein
VAESDGVPDDELLGATDAANVMVEPALGVGCGDGGADAEQATSNATALKIRKPSRITPPRRFAGTVC